MSSLLAAQRTLDDVFQPGEAVPRSHPDHLASIARLFGVPSKAVAGSRVLEIGCGVGLNLLPMADRHPDSTFVGLERSSAALATARQLAANAGLPNVEFHELLLGTIGEGLGGFDYVIGHDLYSRLPIELQDPLWAFCSTRLNPLGVLYLSYRAQPGWIAAGVMRELARGITNDQAPLPQRIDGARKALQFIAESWPADVKGWARMLRSEATLALGLSDAVLVHEHLCAESHPVYFHELADRALEHRLQYLGDADIPSMFAASLGQAAQHNLSQVARDTVSLEQHMDLLCNRSLHRSLFCHGDVRRTYQWTPDRLSGLYLSGNLQPVERPIDLLASEPARFVAVDGRALTTVLPSVKVAFDVLAGAWPHSVLFETLLEHVGDRLATADPALAFDDARRDEMAKSIIECIVNGLVEVHSDVDRFTTEVSERPQAGRWARAEAESLGRVTNRRHEPTSLDELSHRLLSFLDGQRDRAALLALLVEAVERGQLSILRGGLPAGSGAPAAEILEQVLDQALAKLAQHALLVA